MSEKATPLRVVRVLVEVSRLADNAWRHTFQVRFPYRGGVYVRGSVPAICVDQLHTAYRRDDRR